MNDRGRHVNMPYTDLRQLIFWANVGVGRSVSGSYAATIEEVIDYYAREMRFDLPRQTFLASKARRSTKAQP